MGATGLDALVGAATEGMRKTKSAEEMSEEEKEPVAAVAENGHLSDSAVAPTRERKKGVPWTEDEHRLFLLGLQKLGKGDWRGISRHFVQSRTPTQVASHAQKYFIRQNNMNKRKRRSSLFDIVNEPAPEDAAAAKTRPVVGSAPAGAGGLSMAMATAGAGYNPTGMPPPGTFSSHGRAPPPLAGAAAPPPLDVGVAGEAAAATIASLSMAGSPAATAGYQAAAARQAAASAPGRVAAHVPVPAPSAAAPQPGSTEAAALAQVNAAKGFAAMMAQMGAMGGMGGFPAPANWMVSYHQFLTQMQAATAAHAQQQRNAGAGGFPGMGAGMPPAGVTLPPMPGMGWGAGLGVMPGAMPGAAPAMGAMANPAAASLFRPTAVHATSAQGAAEAAPAAERPTNAAEREKMVTAA